MNDTAIIKDLRIWKVPLRDCIYVPGDAKVLDIQLDIQPETDLDDKEWFKPSIWFIFDYTEWKKNNEELHWVKINEIRLNEVPTVDKDPAKLNYHKTYKNRGFVHHIFSKLENYKK